MKFHFVLVGTVCLFCGIQAQTLDTTVANAISTSKFNMATTIQQVNNTINSADQIVLTAWNQYGQSMVDLYNSYYTRFSVYTTIDLSYFANAITNIQNTISYPPMLIQDPQVSYAFSNVQASAQQVEDTLTTAAASITNAACVSPCTSKKLASCTTKHGAKLTADPITMDRVTDCIAAEKSRYAKIGTDMASQYSNVLTSAVNYLAVVNVCDTPAPEALINASANYGPPSTQCLENFLQRLNGVPMNTYVADSMRFPQTQLVSYRMERCAKLVALDIADRVAKVLGDFNSCLG
ncbi:uncharacterized protein LOC134214249 [Armigeres subalbatus]|uniref:uncharacterized protein LOC134214249 n=1 Tax=Armigeres subalbatus TaxID=124917 RepID=UPI002ED4B69F